MIKNSNSPKNNKLEGKGKQFGLTTFALRNKTTVFVLTVLVIFLVISSYLGLPKENFPEIEQPIVYIGTPHPGNSPVDIENLVTQTIEKELNTISDVENITSTSVQDYSTIIVEFSTTTEIQDALTKVKDAVDRAKPELPTDCLLYTSPSPRDRQKSRMPSSA